MQDILLSIILWNAIVITLILILRLARVSQINGSWLLLALGVFTVYVLINKLDLYQSLGFDISAAAKQLNLDGKILGLIAAVILMMIICSRRTVVSFQSIGFTLRQAHGSLVPSLLLISVGIGVTVLLELITKGGGGAGSQGSTSLTAAYAIFAGLDEEIIYRGLLLVLFGLAVGKASIAFFGTRLTIGGLLALVLFAIIHGIKIKNGGLAVSIFGVGLTAFYGFIFLWVREKTGSLLLPVLSHNLINTIAWIL